MRRKVIAGNWKMNKTPSEAKSFFEEFKSLAKDIKNEIIICVPYVDLDVAVQMTKDTNISIGAQNMHYEEKGAFTGEIAPRMIKSLGAKYVIIGHSERRSYYAETDESVNLKVKSALKSDLKPIICVGETLEQREEGITKDFITTQIRNALKDIDVNDLARIIIAYEPIWAIGTGKTASNEDANEACKWIREEVYNIYGSIAEEVIIQYGGSVKSSNSSELFAMSDIDGGLVGGASLDAEEFFKIADFKK